MVMQYQPSAGDTRYAMGGEMIPAPFGQNPLGDNEGIWNKATFTKSTPTENAAYYARQAFQEIFGRNPSQIELNQVLPAFYHNGVDLDVPGGRSLVAQLASNQMNTPANFYKQQQEAWTKAAPDNYGKIGQLVQSAYGREASQDELSHYGMLIASGQADPYEIQQYLMSTPEYQNAQDKQFRQGLDTELQQSDLNFFNRAKGDVIQQYALMGRPTSPALDVALTDLAAQLNDKRQTYLAQLSASQYGGNKAAAIKDYDATKTGVTGRINQNSEALYNNSRAFDQRIQDITDYNTQFQDWQNAMSRFGSNKPGTLDYLNTAFNGINAGANAFKSFSGPGAMA